MPVPDFSPGEVLTAAAMDSIGLWLVKTQTIGTGVSSVEVTGAFSSNYDNYLITVSGGSSSTSTDMRMRLGAATTGYYSFLIYGNYTAATVLGFQSANAAQWGFNGSCSPNNLDAQINIKSPFLSRRTNYFANHSYADTTTGYYQSGGYLDNATSYTAFTLFPATGTMTGGTIRVYGYRN